MKFSRNIQSSNVEHYRLKGKRGFWFIISTLVLWIISGWCTECADLDGYRVDFETDLSFLSLEEFANPGFAQFNIFFKNLGVSFETFHIILFFMFVTIITSTIFKYSRAPLTVIFIYLFTSFFGDVIQIKNTLGLAVLMIGISVLAENKRRYTKILYSLFCILAASFHIALIFYLVFLLVDKDIKGIRVLLLSVALAFVGHFIFSLFGNISLVQESGFLSERADDYLQGRSYVSLAICTFVCAINLYTSKLLFKDTNYSRFLYNINVLLCFSLVFTSISMTFFSRLFRNLIIWNSIFMINSYLDNKNAFKDRVKVLSMMIINFISWSVLFLWMSDVSKNIAVILRSNSFFGG